MSTNDPREIKKYSFDELLEAVEIYQLEKVLEADRKEAAERLKERIDKTIPPDLTPEQFKSVREFCDGLGPQPIMIVDQLFAPNSFVAISAKPKTGKTFMALQIADDVSRGRPVFGKFDVPKPGIVCYFYMEGSNWQLRDRLKARGMYNADSPVLIFDEPKDFSTEAGVQWLIDITKPIGPSLIILDGLKNCFPMRSSWNDGGEVQRKLTPFTRAVQRKGNQKFHEGVCVLGLYHNSKSQFAEGGDKMSGANALQGLLDGYMILDNKRRLDNGNLTFDCECEGRIDMPSSLMTFEMDHQTLEVTLMDKATAVAHRKVTLQDSIDKATYDIARLLRNYGKPVTRDWVGGQLQLPANVVISAMRALEAQNRIVESGNSTAGGKKVATYVWQGGLDDDLLFGQR